MAGWKDPKGANPVRVEPGVMYINPGRGPHYAGLTETPKGVHVTFYRTDALPHQRKISEETFDMPWSVVADRVYDLVREANRG